MTKLNQSQENNLNPNVLPFYESYKSTLLAQATLYGLPIEEKISVSQLYDIINNHELEQIELSKRTAELPIEHSAYASL